MFLSKQTGTGNSMTKFSVTFSFCGLQANDILCLDFLSQPYMELEAVNGRIVCCLNFMCSMMIQQSAGCQLISLNVQNRNISLVFDMF